MLLTITNTRPPATDLGWLLHKNPDKTQTFKLSFGEGHVFYPVATEERCTAALLLDIDPVSLVRGKSHTLGDYVTDRPYVCSSLMSVALGRIFGSAMNGRCNQRPELVEQELQLEIGMTAVPCRCSLERVRALFEPLEYETAIEGREEDGHYRNITLRGEKRLQDVLRHVEVLIAVLDNRKHQFIGEAEVEKLMARGQGWLEQHPEREWIAKRYLQHRGPLTTMAINALKSGDEDTAEPAADGTTKDDGPKAARLHDQRLKWAADTLAASGATSVVDLGCGEGRLLGELLKQQQWRTIIGADPSPRALEGARRRLKLEKKGPRDKRCQLLQSAVTYRDQRLEGMDAAALIEVIEHLEPWGLRAMEQAVFGRLKPATLVLTTPNREYNGLYEGLNDGQLRHRDHRFEWTRQEFKAWCERIAAQYSYDVRPGGIGDEHAERGSPSQCAVFSRRQKEQAAQVDGSQSESTTEKATT